MQTANVSPTSRADLSDKIDRVAMIAIVVAILSITLSAGIVGRVTAEMSMMRAENAELKEDLKVATWQMQKLQADLDAHLRDH